MSDEWLDLIAQCRNGKTHNYDIVEDLWQMIQYGIMSMIFLLDELVGNNFGY